MKKRKKRRFRLFIISIIILGSFLYLYQTNIGFEIKSDYKDEAIANISDSNLKNEIIKNSYSKTVEEALLKNLFEEKYLDIYLKTDYINDEDFILNLNSLIKIGYKSEEINMIFKNIEDITVILNNKYIKDLEEYIKNDHFISENLNRYLKYKTAKNLDYEKTITHININLDYDFYDETVIKEVENPVDELVIVNKFNKIPASFKPSLVTLSKSYSTRTLQVTNNTKIAFEKMCDDALKENLYIKAVSTYRTYLYQQGLYNNYVASDSKENADKYSARAGHSEHHTGLAIDVEGKDEPYNKFDRTNEYVWVKDNAHKYGFIIRYQLGKEHITGYKFEPWHLRYVGAEVATYIYENNITFDEYYGKYLIKK